MSYLPQLFSTLLRPSPLLNWSSPILDSLAVQLAQEIPAICLPGIGLQATTTPASFYMGLGAPNSSLLFAHQVLYPQRHPIRPSYLVFLKKALLMVLLRPDLTSNLLFPFRIKRGFCLVYLPVLISLQTQITFRLRGRWQSPSPGFLSLKKLQDIREHDGSCGSHYSTLQPQHSNSAP